MDDNPAPGCGLTGGNDVELFCKTLQVEQKLFYFDLKQNSRGIYLKISEKTSATRSTIIVPSSYISRFVDVFNYYVDSGDQELSSKELQLDTKAFYFGVGENRRGRFMKVSESSVGRNRSTIIIPSGNAQDEGWAAARNILAEINASSPLIISSIQNSETSDRAVSLSDDVGAGFISRRGPIPVTSPEVKIDGDQHIQDDDGNMSTSKMLRVEHKKFFFDLGTNNRGHFLKISEVADLDRSSIILPLSGLKGVYEIIGHFVDLTKDKLDEIPSINVCTLDPQR